MMEKKIIILVAIIIVGAVIIANSIAEFEEEKSRISIRESWRYTDIWGDRDFSDFDYQLPSPDVPWVPITTGVLLIVVGVGGIIFLAKQSKESLPT